MKEAPETYVLDSSALLAFIEEEQGADIVQNLLERGEAEEITLLVSFMSFMEVCYISLQERDESEAQERLRLMGALPILRVESTEALGVVASQLKASYRISVADAWIAALAKDRNAILVHKDPEFEQVEMEIKVLKWPYKMGHGR